MKFLPYFPAFQSFIISMFKFLHGFLHGFDWKLDSPRSIRSHGSPWKWPFWGIRSRARHGALTAGSQGSQVRSVTHLRTRGRWSKVWTLGESYKKILKTHHFGKWSTFMVDFPHVLWKLFTRVFWLCKAPPELWSASLLYLIIRESSQNP